MCALAATRAEARHHLGDPARAERLVDDILAKPLAAVPDRYGTRRLTLEVVVALRQAGYDSRTWVGGRPWPDEVRADADAVVADVMARLRRNPHVAEPDGQRVARLVGQLYCGVEPWPFSALLD